MQSRSFLGTLGRARRVVSDARDARATDADGASWEAVGKAHNAVCDLVELCTAGLPLPPLDHSPPAEADDAVADVLDDRYREFPGEPICTDGGTDRDSPERTESESAELYAADRRIETVDGGCVVPLARAGPAAANWYVLCDVLPDYAAAVATGCRTLAERQRLGGAGIVGDEWEATADLLGALVDVLDYHTSVARWAYVPNRRTVVAAEDAAAFADQITEETRNFR
ncbi:hypothetical protein [Halobacterium salinarum]|uniref:Uncharacterized protein n=1 Tax=Halobacterium salinarum (strain ATCC 29341 / DSM 671 / R1) TaxID=478009 RepID=B0R992_HALS3|nr:hypothetical protein [Halobacterium salinarum]CAP15397.1 uncharacterized protein OE_6309F [Halobacterium salinarum R1]